MAGAAQGMHRVLRSGWTASRTVRWPRQSKETLERAGRGLTPTIPALKGCKFQIILGGKASSKVAQGIGEGPGSSCFLL